MGLRKWSRRWGSRRKRRSWKLAIGRGYRRRHLSLNEQFLESLYMKEAEVGVTEAREVSDREGGMGAMEFDLEQFLDEIR